MVCYKARANWNSRVTPFEQIGYMNSIKQDQKEKMKNKSYLNQQSRWLHSMASAFSNMCLDKSRMSWEIWSYSSSSQTIQVMPSGRHWEIFGWMVHCTVKWIFFISEKDYSINCIFIDFNSTEKMNFTKHFIQHLLCKSMQKLYKCVGQLLSQEITKLREENSEEEPCFRCK